MKKIAILATILALAFVFACGDSETEEPVSVADQVAKSEGAAEPTPAPEPTTAPEPAPAAASQQTPARAHRRPRLRSMEWTEGSESEERTGGVFRRLWSDPPTLDPHLTTDTTSSGVVVELFSGLVTMNTDLQLVPDIAESWGH